MQGTGAGGAGEAVLGLVPAIRRADEFDQARPGGEADEQEVHRHPGHDRQEVEPLASDAAEGGGQQHGQQSGDEQRHRRPGGKVRPEAAGRRESAPYEEREVVGRPAHEERIDQTGDHGSGNQRDGAERTEDAELAGRVARRPRMGEAGLQEALHPAGALVQPGPECPRRLLQRIAGQVRHVVARPGEANSEIGILGDVPRIPAVQASENVGPEMGRGASERNRNAPGGEGGNQDVEQRRILDGEACDTLTLYGTCPTEQAYP